MSINISELRRLHHTADYTETQNGYFDVRCTCGFHVVHGARVLAGWAVNDHMIEVAASDEEDATDDERVLDVRP